MSVLDDVADLPRQGALMGLDPGSKTIGVAVSDGLRLTATGLETIRRRKFAEDAARLAEIARHRAIVGVVVGLPLNMDGSAGPRAQSARAFARNVAAALDLPVALFDERLSSFAAEEAMMASGVPARRRAGRIDSIAAAIILRGALDTLTGADGSA
ncbi:MAG TPA: Holliday junction resolvase RuvX [Paracoccaceae bacterium]|nr:Holliday junction resolvase RuvX [Paracoccaceae bacterium]